MRSALYVATLGAALLCPWWISIPLIIVSLGSAGGGPVAVGAGLIMDSVYGTQVASLGNVSFVYTSMCASLAYLAIVLRWYMID